MCLDRKGLSKIITRVRPGVGYKYFSKSIREFYECMYLEDLHVNKWYFCNNPTEKIDSIMAGFHFFRSKASALKVRHMFYEKVLCKIEYLHPVAFGKQYGAAAGVAHAIKIVHELKV